MEIAVRYVIPRTDIEVELVVDALSATDFRVVDAFLASAQWGVKVGQFCRVLGIHDGGPNREDLEACVAEALDAHWAAERAAYAAEGVVAGRVA